MDTTYDSICIWRLFQYDRLYTIHSPRRKARHYTTGRDPTYYEVLNVPVTASTAEIKKSVLNLVLFPIKKKISQLSC